jgi:hypothetical protein
MDELEKCPGGQRDEHSDHCREDEQNSVSPAPDLRARVDRGSCNLAHGVSTLVRSAGGELVRNG